MTPALYRKMVAYARKVLRETMPANEAEQLGQDVVHDAIVRQLTHGSYDEKTIAQYVLYRAKELRRQPTININMPEGGTSRPKPKAKARRTESRPTTSTFPVQIFGCMLAAANEPMREAA